MIDLPSVIAKSDDADFLRELIQDAAQRLMDIEGAAVCGGASYRPDPSRPLNACPLSSLRVFGTRLPRNMCSDGSPSDHHARERILIFNPYVWGDAQRPKMALCNFSMQNQ